MVFWHFAILFRLQPKVARAELQNRTNLVRNDQREHPRPYQLGPLARHRNQEEETDCVENRADLSVIWTGPKVRSQPEPQEGEVQPRRDQAPQQTAPKFLLRHTRLYPHQFRQRYDIRVVHRCEVLSVMAHNVITLVSREI